MGPILGGSNLMQMYGKFSGTYPLSTYCLGWCHILTSVGSINSLWRISSSHLRWRESLLNGYIDNPLRPYRPYLFDTKTSGYLRSWCEYHLSPRQRQGRPDPNVIHLAMVERVICWSPKRTNCRKEGRLMSRKCGGFQFSESCQILKLQRKHAMFLSKASLKFH